MIAVTWKAQPVTKRLEDIRNGTFFTGIIGGHMPSAPGPFLKVGSLSCQVWFVIKLHYPDAGNWCSLREGGRGLDVESFVEIDVSHLALNP